MLEGVAEPSVSVGSGDQVVATVAQGVNWEKLYDSSYTAGSTWDWESQRQEKWTTIGDFTLKIDNEIVGLTKHRDHTLHAYVLSASGPTRKEQLFERKREPLFVKRPTPPHTRDGTQ